MIESLFPDRTVSWVRHRERNKQIRDRDVRRNSCCKALRTEVQGNLSRRLNHDQADFQVYLTLQFRKQTRIARKSSKDWFNSSRRTPNRDSLTEDLNKSEEFNPFSEKSKELTTSMSNTEYFELCETSCGKCMQSTERDRQLKQGQVTTSCQSPATLSKKNPTHGARHGPSMRQCVYHKAHDMLSKAPQAQKWWLQNHSGKKMTR